MVTSMGMGTMVSGAIISVSLNTGLLMFIYLIMLVLEYSWSGMAKFMRIMMFPGRILHIASHLLAAKIVGVKTYEVLKIGFSGERVVSGLTTTNIYRTKPHKIHITLLAPMLIAIPTSHILREITMIALQNNRIDVALLAAWLRISIFVLGMPCLSDLTFLGMYHIIRNPETILGLLWGVVVYMLGVLVYGVEAAVRITLLYIALILTASIIPPRERVYIIME